MIGHPNRGNHRQQLLAHALAYAEAGWPVFPLRPGSKRPATPNHTADDCNGTDPRCVGADGHTGWEQRATTDPGRITRAWDNHPWGIGIACGPAGLVVVDLDIAKASGISGPESLRDFEHEHGETLPATFTVATPSGGRHLYYRQPQGQALGNTARRVGPCIDTRAAGGYVAAPPTQLADGNSYHIIDDHEPVELPHWFSRLLTPPPRPQQPRHNLPALAGSERVQRYVNRALDGELRRVVDNSQRGNSNHSLFIASIAVGQLVGADLLALTEAETALEQAAIGQTTRCDRPNSLGEIRKTIASGLRKGQTEPRQLPTNLTVGAGQ